LFDRSLSDFAVLEYNKQKKKQQKNKKSGWRFAEDISVGGQGCSHAQTLILRQLTIKSAM